MWSNRQENEDSAGVADPLVDSVFAIAAALIVALLAAILNAVFAMLAPEIATLGAAILKAVLS